MVSHDKGDRYEGRSLADATHFETMANLMPYLWAKGRSDLKFRVVLALSFMVLAKVIGVYVPFLFKDAVDALSPGANIDTKALIVAVPVGLIFGYGVSRVLSLFFGEMRDAVFVPVGQHALRRVALTTFRHLHNLSLKYHLERKTGGLSRVIERGTRGIDFLLRFLLFNILPTLLEIGMITGIFWVKFGFNYAAITFICLVSYIAFTFGITEWRLKFRREMNKQDSAASTSAIDSFLNYETVKYFTNEDHEADRYDRSLEQYETAAVRSQLSLTFLNTGQNFIISLGLAIVLWIAATGVKQGNLTIGEFVLVNSLLIQIYMPLNFLGMVYRSIKQSLTDMEVMFGMLQVHSDIEEDPNAPALHISGGEIEFKDVSFHYKENRDILKRLSFKVKSGTTTAIVGASGAGKSTISRLLFRFYDCTDGAILIDGQNIKNVNQKSLRQQIGIVPQDTVLFNDTVRYNIAYGKPSANEEDIINAAKLAEIHNFIMSVPEGYEAQVGERGLKLSGGEKQRVAIARTILKNPAILLLDEATSALDSHTEGEIQAALDDISQDRTTIVIAHRLSTITHANEIIVMDHGEIIERGNHNALLARKGPYHSMWQKQLEASVAHEKLRAIGEEIA
jgi:ATP-binding cassette, subfamily B, heavy metal transporter